MGNSNNCRRYQPVNSDTVPDRTFIDSNVHNDGLIPELEYVNLTERSIQERTNLIIEQVISNLTHTGLIETTEPETLLTERPVQINQPLLNSNIMPPMDKIHYYNSPAPDKVFDTNDECCIYTGSKNIVFAPICRNKIRSKFNIKKIAKDTYIID
jgi:hypothetical protein